MNYIIDNLKSFILKFKKYKCDNVPVRINSRWWYVDGKLHRLDGPAIENSDGTQEWYYKGNKIKCSSTEEFLRIVNLKVFW